MRMQRSPVALLLRAIASARGGNALRQLDRRTMLEQCWHMSDRCASASAVRSLIFTFMRTLRLLFATRIA